MTPVIAKAHPRHRRHCVVRDPAAAPEAVVEDQDPHQPAHHTREAAADLLLHRAWDHSFPVCGFRASRASPIIRSSRFWPGSAPLVFAASLWLFYRVHKELGRNWSDSLEVREQHRLVTDGLYRYVRHPMYTAFFMWALAQALLLPNWIAGPAGLVGFGMLFLFRVGREEADDAGNPSARNIGLIWRGLRDLSRHIY